MTVRSAALVPLVLLLLGGCTGGGAEALPSPLPPAPSPSVSASPAALVVPPEARPATAEGASQFARFYLKVLSEAFVSGDVTQLQAISHPDCGTCSEFIKLTKADAAAGKQYEGGAFSPISAEATASAAGDDLVDVFYSRAASTTRDASGAVLKRGPGTKRELLQMRAVRVADRWLARGIRFPEIPR